MKIIYSIKNNKIKKLLKIQKSSKERRKKKIFSIEGIKEINMAHKAKYYILEFFICPFLFNKNKKKLFKLNNKKVNIINLKVFEKISYRKNKDGIIAIAKNKNKELLNYNENIIIFNEVEKPGNLGASFRSIEASGIKNVILNNIKTDCFHPNIIRSSIGTVFTLKININNNYKEIIKNLKKKKYKILLAVTKKNKINKNLYKIKFSNKIAIVIGGEHSGISKYWINNLYLEKFFIPMFGKIDSLNLSNATSIILFEIMRQKYYNF
ncbi:TrmH family RNA methyltransferase [Candidatus Shikimatogenerans silvanidophilus]|uniref:TrmH family RNA methyltransferase n=1 Tax=Candidatus Shikimatogenerans silvanidophilus TaxID=2782547 RepID=UPI001BABA6F1|nr:TrmH family RNA methyltransferase [Candidatus Shikimatogenerans silvanidophilus]